MRRRIATLDINIDLLVVVCFAAMFLYYILQALQLRNGLMSDVVGPKTFPLLIGGLGLAVAITFIASSLVRALMGREKSKSPHEKMPTRHPQLMMVVSLVLYIGLLAPFGYILPTLLYVAFVLKALGQKGWLGVIVFSICLTGFSFVLFSWVFDIRLPPGFVLSMLGIT